MCLCLSYSGVLGKEFVETLVGKSTVNLRSVEGKFSVGEPYALPLAGVAVVVKFGCYSGRSEAMAELIPRFTAVHRRLNPGLHLGNRILIQLLFRRKSPSIFQFYFLGSITTFVEIIALSMALP